MSNKQLAPAQSRQLTHQSAFSSLENFQDVQRMAKLLSASEMVPQQYRGDRGLANTVVALDIAKQIGASPLMVMQNLNMIQGKPSWSSTFIIASLNSCGRFAPLRFVMSEGEKPVKMAYTYTKKDKTRGTTSYDLVEASCYVETTDLTGNVLKGPAVTMTMAVAEGWYSKPGSKWKTMPELMLRYRAAAFFGRLYAPEVLMGMKSEEERYDQITEDAEAVVIETKATNDVVGDLNAVVDKPAAQPKKTTTKPKGKAKAAPIDVTPEPEPTAEDAEHEEADANGEFPTEAPPVEHDDFL